MNNFGIEYENKSCTDNKNFAIMCPVCYQLVGTIKQKITTEIFLDKNGREKIYGHNMIFQIDGYCEYCDEYIEEFVTIDADIAASISLLNHKGYKTRYCCAGHENSEEAYIYFKNNRYLKYIGILPKGWRIDVNDYVYRHDFIIRAKYGKYNPVELEEWVTGLPILTNDKTKMKYITDKELMEILLNLDKDQLDFNNGETTE